MRFVLALAFFVVPLAELFVLIQVGQVIGAGWTVLLLLLVSALGAWLVRREGRRTWAALTGALRTGRMPARELADAAIVLVGGTLLLTPGFLTDLVGAVCILPPTRPLARRILGWLVGRQLTRGLVAYGPGVSFGPPDAHGRQGPYEPGVRYGSGAPSDPAEGSRRPHGPGPVVPGEVVDRDEP